MSALPFVMYMASWELDASGSDLIVDEVRQLYACMCHDENGVLFERFTACDDTYTGIRLEG